MHGVDTVIEFIDVAISAIASVPQIFITIFVLGSFVDNVCDQETLRLAYILHFDLKLNRA
jgi:ABC-type phosphate transport system permease subunit